MSTGFQRVLDHIRAISDTEAEKGRLFERLMKAYFLQDAVYRNRFSNVWLWSEWATTRPDFDAADTGVDLVAEEREGGYCAIQCKCYAPGTRMSRKHVDTFVTASARRPFTARIIVDTGDEWGPNAAKAILAVQPACAVLRFDDLASAPFDWPDLVRDQPEDLARKGEPFQLRPHQQAAFDDVTEGFHTSDRGKLIMACGTGKTFTALRIAESLAGTGGRVLYLVPSISLFQQSMREWAEQRELPHRYIGICSDTRAGRTGEDASLSELEIPVTTNVETISGALHNQPKDAMTATFCTYHSLGLIERAQDDGAPPFDLVLCDEAHRTTGIERPEDDSTSPFVLVHDAARIRASKRLYMTATPRLYTQAARAKAASHAVEVFSMDDPATYGPEFHRLPFSRAIEQGLLSDYKVVVFAISESHVAGALQAHLASDGGVVNLTDAAKIVGCWRALQSPEGEEASPAQPNVLRRAIAFTNTIRSSQRLERHWQGIVDQAAELLPEAERGKALRCETQHVDGQNHALERKAKIEWLKGSADGQCRILSNARCLSEGIDVPALDAVLFMAERKSQVDVVQAVGRAMRRSEGKEYGYIILPIAIAAGADPALVLDSGNQFDVVWSVLRALRSHDDRLDAEINKIDLNTEPTDRIIFRGDDIKEDESSHPTPLPFPPLNLPPGAIYAKIVEKCGDRRYWETWAKDVAAIFSRLIERITRLLDNPSNATLREWFEAFHEELKVSINESITTASAIDMMAQHILTRPVFEALFEQYDFAGGNPVARALDSLRADFGEFGLENETRDLERFYESVRMRARGLDNPAARQRVLMELYERFFATAMKKDADRLGIVYTPVEIVDFILHSADHVLREEFGRSLSDEGVHVLDPFTGTGIFLVRLIESALIRDVDLERKYRRELHANELVLLAYYIAAIHIEEAYHGRNANGAANGTYEPFDGIVLTDTFNLHTGRSGFPRDWLPDNSERAERQQKLPIQVIVGNPPWSAGQRSAVDDNPNVDYPELEQRIAETYAARTSATNKNSLYDSYKMAIRWASDRVGEQGVVALVTNGYWLYGSVDSGVRACLAEEFSSAYVLNLRGNARTSGERRRAEGDNVFGQGSRAPVSVTILVRNPDAAHEGCRILYRDIGDHLSREDKLAATRRWGSIDGVEDWRRITPDHHNDWLDQRDESFQHLYPVGSGAAKAGAADEAVFSLFSNGYKTGRDFQTYNFSREACAANAQAMVLDYQGAMEVREERPEYRVEEIVRSHSDSLRWDGELRNKLRRDQSAEYSPQDIRKTQYRPFIKEYCYVNSLFAQRKYQLDSIFPTADSENRAICVPAIGSRRPFSALVVDTMPDLHFVEEACQCFPRYRFQFPNDAQPELLEDSGGLERVDNVTDTALRAFRTHYQDHMITKDDIFDYVYAILHAPTYRFLYANDLAKEMPRIPLAAQFRAFAKSGARLAAVHLTYETCDEYPLRLVFDQQDAPGPAHYRLTHRPMRFTDDTRTILRINDHLSLHEIPPEAHLYQVNGRTPLEWFIDRYRIRTDKASGITNDPNDWFDDPRDLVTAIKRIVSVSVDTVGIVTALPEPFPDDPRAMAFVSAEMRRESAALSRGPGAEEDQAFVDAISAPWDDE
ncbi:MAG: DEAD/DEAH box helicase [Gammaproteobacteria bacterium]|nr:DEAD/DEAH box helicase [Gammaproteobacteria bacterium]